MNAGDENWDNVEVRERYHRKRESIEALKVATCVFVQTHSKKAIHNLVSAMDAARRAGLTTTEIDEVIQTAAREERKKMEGEE